MANGFIFGGNTGVATPQELQRRRQIANALAQRATVAPRNVGEGLSALGAAIAHRRLSSRIGREEAAGRRSAQEAFAPIGQFLTGGGMDAQAAPATAAGNPQAYRDAIASIESGGNYSAVGPETQGGNRAYGKYQVMDFNIGPWTEEVLGQRLTPEQFLASPEAQDAVFDAKFGQAVEQYGNPSDAASVWFTGRPAAEGAGRSDILGTTGAEYVGRFNQALGGGQATGAPAQGQFTPEIVQSLLAAAQNPYLSGTQRQIVGSLLDRALTPPERPDPVTLGAEEVLVDPRSGQRIATGIGPQQPPFTLSPGQARFGPGGDVIAQAPRKQFRQLTNPQERAQFGIPPEDQTPYQIGPDNRLYAIGPGGTTVNITTPGEEFDKRLERSIIDDAFEARQKALDARSLISTIHQGRRLLDEGAITGAGANLRVNALRWAETLGVEIPSDAADNSQAFEAVMGRAVAEIIKSFGAGTGLSDADREYANKIAAGDIELTEDAIRRIMEMGEKSARARIEAWGQQVPRLIEGDIPSLLGVEMPPEYQAPAAGAVVNGYTIEEVR